jgi:hypothetical protein
VQSRGSGPRAVAALPFPNPRGFPATILIFLSRKPAKISTLYPLLQPKPHMLRPYSFTDRTPRRWPWTKHCHGWVPFPPIRWRGHFGGTMSRASGVRDLLRTRGASMTGVVRVGMCRPALQLPCWHKSAHQCEPTLSLFSQEEDSGGAAWKRLRLPQLLCETASVSDAINRRDI